MGSRLKDGAKRLVGDRGVQTVRSLGRFRWIAKVNAVHTQGARIRDNPSVLLRYVLLDPEFDNFTYELDNPEELLQTLSAVIGRPMTELAAYLGETSSDEALTLDLRRRLRWRIDMKSQPPLGRRYSWYVLARALKPELIVEAGVQDGLGSLALLRALRRNREEGHPGRLLSADLLVTAGWLVPKTERSDWTLEIGSADAVLERGLTNGSVGLFIEDTGAPEHVVRRELDTILAHAGRGAVLVAGNTSGILQAVCKERAIPFVEHHDRAKNHFFRDALTTFAGPINPT
jgi:hypothetical protein